MGKWREIFCSSENCENEDECVFNPPATEQEIKRFESDIGASLPADLREMLLEFNGIDKPEHGRQAPFILGLKNMKLPEFYTDWDVPTDNLLEWSKNIVYVRQFNSFTYLWGIVVKPFDDFKVGDVVEFDHDDIDDDIEASDFFTRNLKSLKEVILD
ncbi:MAG: SMI1/KNR4 family protein [Planctomycetaceae bacterium]|nr:SMI1/KNR4 family protein [Planctomycetaceae bacterium]